MKNKAGIITIILFAMGFGLAVSAKPIETAGELASICAPVANSTEFKPGDVVTKDSINIAFCVGYVSGWVSGVNGMAFQSEGKFRDGQMLVVKLVTTNTRQIVDVFIKWMKQHPESAGDGTTSGLFASLLEAKLAGFEPIEASAKPQVQ